MMQTVTAMPAVAAVLALVSPWQLAAPIAQQELQSRRSAAMERLSDGILLLHARSEAKAEDQPGFQQDATFFYFTGLMTPGAILVLDGPRAQARLFVPPPPRSFGQPVPGLAPEPGTESASRLGLDAVVSWEEFPAWLGARLAEDPALLYVDAPRRPEATGVPPGMRPVAGPLGLWRTALQEAFPEASIASALDVIRELRWRKSEFEVAMLRDNARATAAAIGAVAKALEPGRSQRQLEATVIAGCADAGAQGPSFWPWTMAGPNGHVGQLVRAFYSYEHLDRQAQAGELVRVDVGCRGHGYGADVGRTLPVAGRFSPEQAEVWDLLVEGYLAGLAAVGDEVPVSEVRAASRARVRELSDGLRSDPARRAAELLDDDSAWHLHGVGIESGEEALPVLRAGAVLAYEPMVVIDADAYYLEDMVLVTATGHEVLSAGLPYHAAAIERTMAGARPVAPGRAVR